MSYRHPSRSSYKGTRAQRQAAFESGEKAKLYQALDILATSSLTAFCFVAFAFGISGAHNTLYKLTGLMAGASIFVQSYMTVTLGRNLNNRFLQLYAAFTVFAVLMLFLNPVAMGRASTYVIFFLLTSAVAFYIYDTKRTWPVYYGLYAGVVVIAFSAQAKAVADGASESDRFLMMSETGGRMDSNGYGLLLICLMLLAFKEIFIDVDILNRSKFRKIIAIRNIRVLIAILGIGLAFYQIIYSLGSRGTLASLFAASIGLGIIIMVERFSPERLISGTTAAVALVLLIWYQVQGSVFQERFATFSEILKGTEASNSSSATRADMIQKGLRMWMDSPIIGNGPEYFRHHSEFGKHCHCNFVEILVSLGAIGFIFYYGAFLFLIMKAVIRFDRMKGKGRVLAGWNLVVVFCLLLAHFSQVTFGYHVAYTIMLGVVASYSLPFSEPRSRSRVRIYDLHGHRTPESTKIESAIGTRMNRLT